MNLREANSLAIKLMREHGLVQDGWKFKFDRGTKRFGVCKYVSKTIGLSKSLTEVNPREAVENTITHEIAHALVGHAHKHDHVWAAKHRELGGDGKARYDLEDVTPVRTRYRGECRNCHREFWKTRRPTRAHSCRCGTNQRGFDPSKLIEYTDTHTRRDVTVRPALERMHPSRGVDPLGAALADLGASIPIVDVPALVAANEPEPERLILKRVDSHEWQTKDGTVRFIRGWADTSERTWTIVDNGTVRDGTYPTLRAAKEAYQK